MVKCVGFTCNIYNLKKINYSLILILRRINYIYFTKFWDISATSTVVFYDLFGGFRYLLRRCLDPRRWNLVFFFSYKMALENFTPTPQFWWIDAIFLHSSTNSFTPVRLCFLPSLLIYYIWLQLIKHLQKMFRRSSSCSIFGTINM